MTLPLARLVLPQVDLGRPWFHRARRRWTAGVIVFLLIATLTVGSSASAAPSASTSAASAEETVTVIVTLEDQMLLPGDASGRRSQIGTAKVSNLREHAERTQGQVRQDLEEMQAAGDVSSFEPLWIFNGFIVEVHPGQIDELEAIPGVAQVTLDRPIGLAQSFAPPEPGVATIGAPALWDLGYTGQGVVIASLDTGVDVTHPDLAGRWRGGSNSWFDPYGDSPVVPIDPDGHGTEAISLAVGGDGGGTTIGVAPDATFIAAKIFNAQGGSTLANVHAALQWVLDPDNNPLTDDAPHIVNNSWTFLTPGCDLEFELDLLALRAAGILPVFAGGNLGPVSGSSTSPANNPSALSVGAVNASDVIASTSSRGPNACNPAAFFPDIVAPGVGETTAAAGGGYTTSTGTSFSAPYVSGAAALLLSASPWLPVDELETAIIAGAVDLGPSGDDDTYGAGRLDVGASLAALPVPEVVYLSFTANTTLPDVGLVADEDIVSYDTQTGLFAMAFDGSDVGIGRGDIDAVTVLDADTILMSFTAPLAVPGISGTVDDSDIVQFDATALGPETTGAFSPFFDGSANDLTVNNEDVDAAELLATGQLLISTTGNPSVAGVNADTDEDLLVFTPNTPGDYSSGTWSMYFDGSDIALTTTGEDITGAFVDGTDLALATLGNFNVTDLTGTNEDIFTCNQYISGQDTSCMTITSFIDGTAIGVPSSATINGIDLVGQAGPPPAPNVSVGDVSLAEGSSGSTTSFDFTVSLNSAPTGPVSVDVSTADDTADSTDYAAVVGQTLTWDIGDPLSQTVTVNVTADEIPEATETFFVNLSAPAGLTIGDPQGVGTIIDDDTVAEPIYMSFLTNTNVPGLGVVADEDIVSFNPATDEFAMVFDGSDVGVATGNVDGFAVVDTDTILLSFATPQTLAGVGDVTDDSDVVEFSATGLGPDTAGTFSPLFDGSLHGLTTNGEDIDAVELLPDGTLLISTTGNPSVPGVTGGRDEDLLAFAPTTPGDFSTGSWSLYFDSTDVALSSSGEDVNGAAIDGPDLVLTTLANFAVPGASGTNEDLFSCGTVISGPNTACVSVTVLFDGTAAGLPTSASIDGISR